MRVRLYACVDLDSLRVSGHEPGSVEAVTHTKHFEAMLGGGHNQQGVFGDFFRNVRFDDITQLLGTTSKFFHCVTAFTLAGRCVFVEPVPVNAGVRHRHGEAFQ